MIKETNKHQKWNNIISRLTSMPLLKKTAKLKYIFLKEAENFEQIIIPVSEMIKQTQTIKQ